MIVALLVATDLVARGVMERQLADHVASEVPSASSTSVHIRSFPFLAWLLATGEVGEVDVTVRGVDVRGLQFDSISADVRSVAIDRTALLQDRRLVIEDIERGTVRAEVTEAAISALAPVPVRLGDGEASVEVFGREVSADLAVEDGRLVIGAVGVAIPGLDLVAPLLPCLPDAEIAPGRLVLTCGFEGVPAELLD